ncbi:uncharacterized protein ACBT44_004383 [Syngnathus typhle]
MYLFVHADFSDCPKFSIFSVYVYICHHRDTKKESNLAKARAALDSEATERERLQVKLSKLKIDFDELEARDTKKESDLAKARAALDSEATERERLQVKLSKLKIDFDELEARDTKKESNLAKARAALDSEATERERLQVKLSKLKIDFDELEARKSHHIQILKDELEFEKKLHSAVGNYHHYRLFN